MFIVVPVAVTVAVHEMLVPVTLIAVAGIERVQFPPSNVTSPISSPGSWLGVSHVRTACVSVALYPSPFVTVRVTWYTPGALSARVNGAKQ